MSSCDLDTPAVFSRTAREVVSRAEAPGAKHVGGVDGGHEHAQATQVRVGPEYFLTEEQRFRAGVFPGVDHSW